MTIELLALALAILRYERNRAVVIPGQWVDVKPPPPIINMEHLRRDERKATYTIGER